MDYNKKDLGANHSGKNQYIALRYTQIVLLFLSIWFVWFAVGNIGLTYGEIVARISGSVINSSLLLLFVLTALYHFNIVLEVIIDDYVHGHVLNIFSKVVLKLFLVFLAAVTVVSMVYIIIV